MAGSLNKSNKKRKGSLLGCAHSSKKSVSEVEEAIMLGDDTKRSSVNPGDESQNSSYLARMIEMAQQSIEKGGENLCHLASLANLASDKQAANELVKLGIERKIGNHLLNKNLKIQEKVAGILRNLSAAGGVDVCVSLIENDIVTLAGMSVKENVRQMHCFVNRNETENLKEVSYCLRQLISLLWNLCEASETGVALFNGESIELSLLEVFHIAQNDKELLLSIVQCLCAVTDENDVGAGMLMTSQSSLHGIIQLLDAHQNTMKDLHIASTASGILFNILGKLEDTLRSEVVDKMLKIVMYALGKCCIDELKDISLNSEQQKMIDDYLDLLTAKQICLELLANLLCYEEEHEMMETSDEDNDGLFCEQNYIDTAEFPEEMSKFQIYLKDFLDKNKVADRVKDCITYIDIAELQPLKENDDTISIHRALARVQKSALACFGNILDINTSYDLAFLENMWSTMIRIPYSKPDEDEEFLLEFTGCLRALAMAMMHKNSHEFLTNNSFDSLEKWYHVAKDEQAKCNLLKIFGIAGKLFSQQEAKMPRLQKIATIIDQELVAGNSIMMITEALDTTFDAFGEDGICDSVLASSGLGKRLCQMPAVLKAKMKSMKGIGQPYRSLIRSTRVNLDRFISYKKLK